ncbi:MAG: nucleotidyltransferase family protein [Roseateles sp.]
MERFDLPLLPAATVRAALRLTTERFAAELASPTDRAPDWTDRAPDWNDFEWRTAIAVSVMHGISALLADRLRWAGPPHWQAFLEEQAEQGKLRERKVRALLTRLDEASRRANLPLLAMKGSALLALGLYEPGQRPQSDVDLLARPGDFDATHQLVLKAGYAEGVTMWKHRDYLPLDALAVPAFGEHEANPIKIELHTAVHERLPVREVAITAQVFPADAQPGLNAYPSLAALMRHLLLHAAGNLCGCGIRLIQLHDIAALAERLSQADWDEALTTASDGLPAWWAVPPLELAQRLFPSHWPHERLARARAAALAACPARLRRAALHYPLDQVSMSRYSVPMLPGIEWSHGVIEALQCARLRLHPGRKAVAQSRRAAANVHAFASSPWVDQSRWQKALRFLLGAPPRVTTMYSLRRAMAYEPAHANFA